jgi:type IV pilus assembly protein PilP
MIKRPLLLLSSLLCAALAGCGGARTDDLDDWMSSAGAGLKGHIEPLPVVQPYQPLIYNNAQGLLDPFDKQKLLRAQRQNQNSANAPDLTRPREVLEGYELDKLHMVGSLKRGDTTFALVRIPDGTIVRVHVGNYMGTNFGRISKIAENQIELTETVEDLNGEWVQHVTTVALEEGSK